MSNQRTGSHAKNHRYLPKSAIASRIEGVPWYPNCQSMSIACSSSLEVIQVARSSRLSVNQFADGLPAGVKQYIDTDA
jgi:hypothetical protein